MVIFTSGNVVEMDHRDPWPGKLALEVAHSPGLELQSGMNGAHPVLQ